MVFRSLLTLSHYNLGYHSAAFRLDTYAHATAQMKKESADRMHAHIQAIKSCKG